MARALEVELPRSLHLDEVKSQVLDTVNTHLKARGIRPQRVDAKTYDNILPISLTQIEKVAKQAGIIWRLKADAKSVFVILENEEEMEVSYSQAQKISSETIQTLLKAVDDAAFFMSGGITSLMNVNKS